MIAFVLSLGTSGAKISADEDMGETIDDGWSKLSINLQEDSPHS